MFRLLFATVCLFGAIFSATAQDAPPDAKPALPDAETAAAADRLNRLGLALLANAREARRGNLVISSWPTYRSLSLAMLGAAGETRKEIAAALGTDDPVDDQLRLLRSIDPQIAQWNQLVAARRPGERVDQVEWGSLSAVWLDQRVKVLPAFMASTQRMHGTLVRGIDLSNAGKAVVDVNQWVAQLTQNRIQRLLDGAAFGPLTRMCITSATFFKAPWAYMSEFKPEHTKYAPFHLGGGKLERVPTMARRGQIGSAMHDDFTALSLQTCGDFQLLVLVPKEPDGLAALQGKLTPELLRSCAQMKSSRIELHIPKFRIGTVTMAVREPLQRLGIRAAFERDKADFSGMAAESLHLDNVYDAAEFRIDEAGLSGAAATVVMVSVFGGDPSTLPADSVFRVNRPFAFALQNVSTGLCVFIGQVTDPR